MDRNEMRVDLEHYQRLMINAIRADCRKALSIGYTPLSGALAMVVKWLKADRAGDTDIASVDAWWDASLTAAQTWQEWEMENNGIMIMPREELDGFSMMEFANFVRDEWDAVQRDAIGSPELELRFVEAAPAKETQ